MIIFHAIFARKFSEANGYPVIAAFGNEGHAAVLARYNELTGESGQSFREEHAEMELISRDGDSFIVQASHFFPDPTELRKQREQNLLTEALRLRQEEIAAEVVFSEAAARIVAAKESFESLTPEAQSLLEEHDAKIRALSITPEEEAAARAAFKFAQAEEKRIALETAAHAAAALEQSTSHTAALEGALATPDFSAESGSNPNIPQTPPIAATSGQAADPSEIAGVNAKPSTAAEQPAVVEAPDEDLTIFTIAELQARSDSLGIDDSAFRKNVKADYIKAIQEAEIGDDEGPALLLP